MKTNEADIFIINNLVAGYPSAVVLEGIDISFQRGEICGIIGEEGAGKSTLLKALTGQIIPKGSIVYNGKDISGLPTHKIIQNNMDFIVQGGNILPAFTVEEHLRLAVSGKSKKEATVLLETVVETFPIMKTLKKQYGGTLSGGERTLLSIACVLATNNDLLILDEPTAGLSPEMCCSIEKSLLYLKKQNKTVLLLEHNYDFVFGVADSVGVLKDGKMSRKFRADEFTMASFIENELYQ